MQLKFLNFLFSFQLTRLLELKEFCLELAVANVDFRLDDATWNELPHIVGILGLFSNKMEYLRKENISLSDVCGVWLELESRLKKMESCPVAIALLERLEIRKSDIRITENEVTLSAMFLDLRYQFILTTEQKEKAKNHLLYLWQKISSKKQVPESEETSIFDGQQNMSENDDNENALEQIMRELESSNPNVGVSGPNLMHQSIVQEMDKFSAIGRAKATDDIIDRWQSDKFNFPILYELAMTVMAVAPTEVSVERNFSALDFILTKRRNRLTDENLQMILFIKLNQPLFYKAFKNGELDLN